MAPEFIWEIEAYNLPLDYIDMDWRRIYLTKFGDWSHFFDGMKWLDIKRARNYGSRTFEDPDPINNWWLK